MEAGASDVTLAERYAGEAFEAYRVRDYGRAVALYEQALAAAPSPDIVYNIARVYDTGLANRRLAIVYYERYAAAPRRGARSTGVRRASAWRSCGAAERTTQSAGSADIDAIAREFPLDVPEPAPAPAPGPCACVAGCDRSRWAPSRSVRRD